MADDWDLKSVRVIKRKQSKLPSLRRHIIRALALLVLLFSGIWIAGYFMSNPRDAVSTGEVKLGQIPLPVPSDTLNGDTEALPDLLQGEVPEGVNPTVILDALGNPVDTGVSDGLAGGQAVAPAIIRPRPQSAGPRTILIDGEPLDGASIRSPLPPAPYPGLSRASPFGPIPVPAPDGRKVVSSYARPFAPAAGKQSVALIVGGLGIDQVMTRRAISELPAQVTLSFAAHTPNLQSWIDQARISGHEVLLELPMDSQSYNPSEPGAGETLRIDLSPANNIRNLDRLLSKGLGYFAVTNYNGDKLVRRADILAPILAHLSDAGLGFIYDGSTPAHTLPALSSSSDLPFVQAFNIIDNVSGSAAAQSELRRLEAQASAGATPIGVGFGFSTTLDSMTAWIATLPAKNIELAPASYALGR